ncbi:MAG: rod shape-determining protein RodA [Desulfamplus sp.]|nr:rod shape-determining protein RodA [Desulfamplus sp.]
MFDRRFIDSFDWGLLVITIFTIALGLVVLYSAVTAGTSSDELDILFKKQIIWLSGGFLMMGLIVFIPLKTLDKGSLFIYFASVFLLVAVLFLGKHAGGAQRWLAIGPFTVQPSEMMKLSLIIALSSVFSGMINEMGLSFRDLIKPGLILLLPFVLILVQPDLGTSLLLVFIAASMTLFVKVKKEVFFTFFAIGLAVIPLAWNFILKDYQKSRVLTFLDPSSDPLGAGYHIIQSKIAIGSGMLWGKGYLQGTQNALAFLPEHHTDFILSVFAEEWGLSGSAFLLFLYFMLILWGLNISYCCRDMFGSILAFGVTVMIFWQIFINISMVMGLMPVVGVPLPLISYGGSSIITNMIGIGILLNVSIRGSSLP